MRTVQIVCWCKALVVVRDHRIETHSTPEGEPCSRGSACYIPQKIHPCGEGPGRPSFELVSAKPIDCPQCGEPHGLKALFKVSEQGNPRLN